MTFDCGRQESSPCDLIGCFCKRLAYIAEQCRSNYGGKCRSLLRCTTLIKVSDVWAHCSIWSYLGCFESLWGSVKTYARVRKEERKSELNQLWIMMWFLSFICTRSRWHNGEPHGPAATRGNPRIVTKQRIVDTTHLVFNWKKINEKPQLSKHDAFF